MLSPVPDSDRARLATGPFGPQPEHPDQALGREEAPARARDLPAPPDLVNLRNDNNTSKSQSRAHWLPLLDLDRNSLGFVDKALIAHKPLHWTPKPRYVTFVVVRNFALVGRELLNMLIMLI